MDQRIILLTILGMTLVTFLPRLLPVWFLSSREMPVFVRSWLRYVPTAVLAAMLFPSILVVDHKIDISMMNNLFFWAAIPTALVAWKTRSLFGSVFAGMLLIALVRLFTSL